MTTLLGDIGSVKTAIKTLLTGPEFERLLVAVEARFVDGVTLPRVPASAVVTTALSGLPGQFPWCEIDGERSESDQASEYADRMAHRLAITWWAGGDDEETVTKICERYVLATRKLLRQPRERLMPMIGCLPIRRGSERYGLIGTHALAPFVKAGEFTCVVTTFEA